MAIRKLRYNDDNILRKKCRKVPVVDDKIRELLDDMMDTLHEFPHGAALAANQVGILKRLVVVDYGEYVFRLVNPEIIESLGTQECIEGCLSFPNRAGKIIRPQKVIVHALNENGEEVVLTGEGVMAKCFCHEIDHLDGLVFLDKVSEFLDV